MIAQEGNSTATGYKVIESKPDIEAGDYFENFAFVGRTVSKNQLLLFLMMPCVHLVLNWMQK